MILKLFWGFSTHLLNRLKALIMWTQCWALFLVIFHLLIGFKIRIWQLLWVLSNHCMMIGENNEDPMTSLTIHPKSETQISLCLWFLSQWTNLSDVLHRAQRYDCHALCEMLEYLVDINGWYELTGLLWDLDSWLIDSIVCDLSHW